MPKRKVTFQGVGDEEDEEEIGAPKKKVRAGLRVLGRKRELEAREGRSFGEKERVERAGFSCSLRGGLGDFQVGPRSWSILRKSVGAKKKN